MKRLICTAGEEGTAVLGWWSAMVRVQRKGGPTNLSSRWTSWSCSLRKQEGREGTYLEPVAAKHWRAAADLALLNAPRA